MITNLSEEMYDVLQHKVVVCWKFFGQNTLHLHQSLLRIQSFSCKHINHHTHIHDTCQLDTVNQN